MFNVVQGLRAAKEKIAKPSRWVKDRSRLRTRDGMAYCAIGAVEAVAGRSETNCNEMKTALSQALPRTAGISRNWGGVLDYNDKPRTTHKQIMALFDRAIKLATKNASKS